jgi:Tol biopolymer transport system component
LPSDHIVFHSNRGGDCCRLFIVDPATHDVEDLQLVGAEPSWSPGGQFIVFHRKSQIWVADANGHHAREILDAGTGNPDPAW